MIKTIMAILIIVIILRNIECKTASKDIPRPIEGFIQDLDNLLSDSDKKEIN